MNVREAILIRILYLSKLYPILFNFQEWESSYLDDALSLSFAYQLGALEVLAREDPYLERSIEIYVIAEENGTYFLHRWSSARSLLLEIDRVAYEHLPQLLKLTPEEKEPKILEFLKDFDDRIRGYLRNIVIKEGKNPSNRWESFSCTLE